MILGVCTIELYIPGANSLKDKRKVIKSIIQRIRNKYKVSICELYEQDIWRRAVLGISCISNDKNIIFKTFSGIEKFIEEGGELQISDLRTEIL